ncbi:MAG TPA: hypothetical protein VEC36_07425, partial [Patescibacteria group bacterium]|nr:hypothetical protein [Patescibacteria group bacterium]
GPLYRGQEFRGENRTWFTRYNAMEFFRAFDFAISAGGYNSVYELLYCGIPTIFYPQARLYDDQAARVEFLKNEGLCLLTDELDDIFKKIEMLVNDSVRAGFKKRALQKFSQNFAFETAAHILKDHISDADLERAEMLLQAENFAKTRRLGIGESDFLKMIFELDYKRRYFEKKVRSEEFFVKYHGEIPFKNGVLHDVAEPEEIADLALEFLKRLLENGIDAKKGVRFFKSFAGENVLKIATEREMVFKAFDTLIERENFQCL